MSLAIALVIVMLTWSLFRQSLHMLFDGVPDSVDLHAVRANLQALPGVQHVHDLHVWATGTSQIVMTAHLVVPSGYPDDSFFREVTRKLHDQFDIDHVTIQVVREAFTKPCE